jgi:LysM repeat protein
MSHPTSRLAPRLIGLSATVGIVLFVVGTPRILFTIGVGPTLNPDWNGLRDMLASPDDGTLALKVLALVAWLAWLVMAVSLLVETVARLRGVHAPRLPGLGVPQVAAGRLVAAASLLFIALPVVTQAVAPPSARATEFPRTLVPEQQVAPAPAVPVAAHGSATAVTPTPDRKEPPTADYTVKRGDSLWKIAAELLGDGKRYVEIVDLNRDVLNGKPDFVTPGAVLRIPSEEAFQPKASAIAETYTVKRGDTLSEIALDELGDPMRSPEVFEASRDTVQPDGAHLSDPNLIRPGWELTIPGEDAPEPPDVVEQEPQPDPPQVVAPPVEPTPTPEPTGEPTAEPTESAEPRTHADVSDPPDEADEVTPGWLLPGLAGAGAVLAGALLLAVRGHRSTQLRFRRPGHIIVPPPPELRAVEKTAHVVGTAMAPQVERLDAALRWLAGSVAEPPAVESVELAPDAVVLHLAQDADLPAPWEGNGTTWSLTSDAEVPADLDQLAPYPLLVTVGRDEAEHLWLLNLEHLGVVTVIGDPTHAEAFGRYVAAELALNPWSALVEVDTLGLAAELATIAPLRLHHHADGDIQFLDYLARDLEADPGYPGHDPEQFHAVVSVNGVRDTAPVRKIVKIITSHPGRPGAAVVAINSTPEPNDVILELATGGRLVASSLDLDVTAAGLTAAEAAACAAIVDITRDADNALVPVDETAAEGWRGLIDAAGALRAELVEARPVGPAGEESLLPLAAVQYADAAPTTIEDIETLAPVTKPETKARFERADPDLDADLAAWFSKDCPLPRLTLLGPVDARTRGNAAAAIKRKPYCVELLAFLALRPRGATTDEILEAFAITKNRARVDLTALRSWLGRNPRTSRDHLPDARKTRAAADRGTAAYQVEDVLCDADLFRRLRARGQARGSLGVDDLTAALRLVAGEPFSDLRDSGWSWLLEGDRIDQVIASAIVDVAHLVTTHALAAGDLDLARFSAETSCIAAPYDDIGRLDLVQVASLMGQSEDAQRYLVEGVFNRSDDDLGPVDLPDRTARIVRQRTWTTRPRTTE